MNSNSLKRSFSLDFKNEDESDCGCESNTESQNLEEVFDQSQGVASFLNEQSNPLEEEEDELPDEMKDQQFTSDDEEDEEEMEEGRGAVEEVLGDLNADYEPKSKNEDNDRGAVEDVLQSLNKGEADGYGMSEESNEIQDEVDQVVSDVLSDLNEDEEQLNEDDPCWEDYTMVGMKTDENGNEVPNCVPDDEAENYQEESASLSEDELLETVLEDQVNELTRLDQLAEEVLNG